MSRYPKLKLTYFDGAGRAEPIRLAFHIGGVPFVDERLSRDEFAKRKPFLVYGQLPVLEVDGVELAQSQAILRYAGKLAGLYPVNDPVSALQVDEILGGLDEFLSQMVPLMIEQDAEKKKATRIELVQVTFPRYLTILDKRLAMMKKNPVFQGDEIFIHELAIYSQLLQLQSGRLCFIPANIVDGYPDILAAASRVKASPKVQQWNVMHGVPTMPKLKLTYLDIPARGEAIRLAFVLGGIPFEDERISREEVAKRREAGSLPFGQVPVLDINGQVLSQSLAILRYAGTLAGLYPTNDPTTALRADEIVSLSEDAFAAASPVIRMHDSEAKIAAAKTLAETTLPRVVALLDKRIASWDGLYPVGETMTIADLIVYSMIAHFKWFAGQGLPAVSLSTFESVVRVCTQVRDNEKVKAWLAQH